MPALQDLVKVFMRAMTAGDSSQWDAALQARLRPWAARQPGGATCALACGGCSGPCLLSLLC